MIASLFAIPNSDFLPDHRILPCLNHAKIEAGNLRPLLFHSPARLLCFVLIEAVPAIDRLVSAGLEGDLGILAALGADRWVHLARASAHAAAVAHFLRSAVGPAGLAALGFIGVTLGSEEFLFLNCKGKLLAAIGTDQFFLCVSH